MSKCSRVNIRIYNSMFQFTFVGGRVDEEVNSRLGQCVMYFWAELSQDWFSISR